MPILRRCGRCGRKIQQGTVCECSKEYAKEYNRTVRYNKDNKEYTQFYNSTKWKKKSKLIRNKYSGLCLHCLIVDHEVINCDVVHHIVELKEDMDKGLDDDNLITLCHRCHNYVHGNYDENKKEMLRKLKKIYDKNYI